MKALETGDVDYYIKYFRAMESRGCIPPIKESDEETKNNLLKMREKFGLQEGNTTHVIKSENINGNNAVIVVTLKNETYKFTNTVTINLTKVDGIWCLPEKPSR